MMNGAHAPVEPELSARERRFLRYWSVAMVLSRQCDWRWIPGFTYHQDEEERLRDLALRTPLKAVVVWLAASVVIVVLSGFAALVVIAGLAFLMVWRTPGDVSGQGSYAAMGMVLILTIAAGVPLSVGWGGVVAERLVIQSPPSERSIDVRLVRRIEGQLRRASATFALVFAMIALFWVTSLN
ncbi:MAG: hypothetical protein ACRDQZ_00380 [Mycobacteriales bacterium]